MAMRINCINSAIRNSKLNKTKLFKEPKVIKETIDYNGTNLIQNSHLNFWDRIIFRALDAISPMMDKHSILKNNIIKITEKIIKTHNNI